MKNLALVLIALASTSALADSPALWTCQNSEVKITARQPYLGDGPGRKYAQTLYTVMANVGGQFDESMASAYFLSTSEKATGTDMVMITGTNGKQGVFSLGIVDIVEDFSGPGYRFTGKGILRFNHGYLKNENVAVDCIKE